MVADMINTDKETFRHILHNKLNMNKVCANMIPKNVAYERITILEHPTYSPDLAPCDFYLFQ